MEPPLWGDFFKHFGYSVAGWEETKHTQWNYFWHNGNFEAILKSKLFKNTQVFEDTPFWFPEFYKVLYHRFPNAKFILFTRNTDDWFESLLWHNKGKVAGNFKIHCKVHARETDYYKKIDTNCNYDFSIFNQESLLEAERHYKQHYETRNREVIDFFKENDSNRLIVCDLDDKDKWQKVGSFFGINIPEGFEIHANRSSEEKRAFTEEFLKNRTNK